MIGDKTALVSRYGTVNSHLVEAGENEYEWYPDNDTPYGVHYSKDDENEIYALDPVDGGPYFSIGYAVGNSTVTRIRKENGKIKVFTK